MENQTNQTPIQEEILNQPSKRFSVLSIVLIFIALLALFFTIFLAYKNMQLQKQIVLLQTIPSTTLQPDFDQDMPVAPPVVQQNNNWRTYSGETFSFQYPNSWADVVTTKIDKRVEVVSEGNLVVSDGQYFNQDLNRPETYQEYVQETMQVMGHIVATQLSDEPYTLGNLKGRKYVYDDNAGRTAINIILSDAVDSYRIFSLRYMISADIVTATSTLEPILTTFKFK